jgi:hypothetical protein
MLIPVAVFLLSLASCVLFALLFRGQALSVSDKVDRYMNETGEEEGESFRNRILSPLWRTFKRTAVKISPPHILRMLDTYCMYAGTLSESTEKSSPGSRSSSRRFSLGPGRFFRRDAISFRLPRCRSFSDTPFLGF